MVIRLIQTKIAAKQKAKTQAWRTARDWKRKILIFFPHTTEYAKRQKKKLWENFFTLSAYEFQSI